MIRLTLRQMEYFEALAATHHFGRAAELCGVTQPALSAQIAQMEKRLGQRLFNRDGRRVELTDEGRRVAPRIAEILERARRLEEGGTQVRAPMEGRFRLGVIPTIAPYLLPVLLPILKVRFPTLAVEMREAVTATLVEETAAGRLDCIVAALPLDHQGLTIEPLFEDRFFLAVPSADPGFVAPPVPPESPALERLMLLEEGHCMRDQALAVCGRVRPAAMANYGATSLTTLLQMVAHGQGVTMVPEMAVAMGSLPEGLRVVPFSDPPPSRSIGLAWRRNSDRAGDYRLLAKIIGEVAAPAERPELTPPPRPPEGAAQASAT